jgi:hypothetical protein
VQRVSDLLWDNAAHLSHSALASRVLTRSNAVADTDELADSKAAIAIACRIVDLGAEDLSDGRWVITLRSADLGGGLRAAYLRHRVFDSVSVPWTSRSKRRTLTRH